MQKSQTSTVASKFYRVSRNATGLAATSPKSALPEPSRPGSCEPAAAPGAKAPASMESTASRLSGSGLSHCVSENEGLAHDAGNLLGALGLYCDLLSQPGVVSPEARQYVAELRGLGQRSSQLIGRLLAQHRPAACLPELVVGLPGLSVGQEGGGQQPARQGLWNPGWMCAQSRQRRPAPTANATSGNADATSGEGGGADRETVVAATTVQAANVLGRVGDRGTCMRVDATGLGLVQSAAEIGEVVRGCMGLIKRIAGPRVSVEMECLGVRAASPVGVEAMERILVNLTCNAASAMPNGGKVRITVQRGGGASFLENGEGFFSQETAGPGPSRDNSGLGQSGLDNSAPGTSGLDYQNAPKLGHHPGASTILLCVQDSGPGMAQETVARFLADGRDRSQDEHGMERAEDGADGIPARPGGQGTLTHALGYPRGLGLLIVRELVEQGGGVLRLVSQPGRGSRMEMEWPEAPLELASALPSTAAQGFKTQMGIPLQWHIGRGQLHVKIPASKENEGSAARNGTSGERAKGGVEVGDRNAAADDARYRGAQAGSSATGASEDLAHHSVAPQRISAGAAGSASC